MAKLLEMPREPALAAANVDGAFSRRRQEVEKLVAMKSPVAVVTGSACPRNPFSGVRFPAVTEIHGTILR